MTEFWFQQNGLLLEKFIDAAILSRHGVAGGRTIIDFYVTSERAYVIAYWVRQWHRLLRRPVADCQTELSLIARNGAMAEAFRWFVRQVPNRDILRELGEAIQRVEDRAARVLIALILCDYLAYAKREDQERDDEEHEKLSEFFDELTMKARDGQTELTDVLVHLISDPDEELEVRRTCAVGLGTFDPELCLRSLALGLGGSRNPQEIVVQSLEPGFRQAVDGIIEMYYGNPLCPSYLESLEGDEERSLEEYNRLIDCGRSAIQLFRFSNSAKEFEDLLCILNPQHHPFPDYRKQRNLFD